MELIISSNFKYIYSHKTGISMINDVREMLCEVLKAMNSFVVPVAAIRGMLYELLANFFCLGSATGV